MLLKEKIFLSNCDSVRRLNNDELNKRFLLGVTFTQGVILTPSLLLDNLHFVDILSRSNIRNWYLNEGAQSISIRTPGSSAAPSMVDYFDALPANYVLNRFQGKTKGRLDRLERRDLRDDLGALDKLLRLYDPQVGCTGLKPNSLSESILTSDTFAHWRNSDGAHSAGIHALLDHADHYNSRSDWYSAVETELGAEAQRFRTEVVDTAYHSLFVNKGETFAMDRIAALDRIPASLLDVSISMRNQRKNFKYIGGALTVFNLVSSLGTNELLKFVTDEAVSYLEERAQEKGFEWANRSDWFGLYPKLISKIGVEIK